MVFLAHVVVLVLTLTERYTMQKKGVSDVQAAHSSRLLDCSTYCTKRMPRRVLLL
jgi:hypothetical protein